MYSILKRFVNQTFLLTTFVAGSCVGLYPLNSFAENMQRECKEIFSDISIEKLKATASVWSNFRGAEGSISFESNRIFNNAKKRSEHLTAPPSFCPPGCILGTRPVLIFRSAPHVTLSEYDDRNHCKSLFAETSKRPLQFQTTKLHTVDELNDWIGDLSQGKSDEGEALYEKCDGSCSPRYEYTVAKNGEGVDEYIVKANVVCGEARDKDDNMYDLEAFFRWACISQ